MNINFTKPTMTFLRFPFSIFFSLNISRLSANLISKGTISHIFVAKYVKDFNSKLEVLTLAAAKCVYDLTL